MLTQNAYQKLLRKVKVDSFVSWVDSRKSTRLNTSKSLKSNKIQVEEVEEMKRKKIRKLLEVDNFSLHSWG